MRRILILGAKGQVGSELLRVLDASTDVEQVYPTDIKPPGAEDHENYLQLDATSKEAIHRAVVDHGINEVYLMAAMLSATAEKKPLAAWGLNMDSLLHVLELAKDGYIKKIFWPSSIAVFGRDSQKIETPQQGVTEPGTVYGISKVTGEMWCKYYHERYGVDVRSLRYPGLIGSGSLPGGGTTDYAVHIFYDALEKGSFTCFLSPDRVLPMMHMEDAVRATLEIMAAPQDSIKVRTSYNIAGMSFDPQTLSKGIQQHIPEFRISYEPDTRDIIAASWPESIDDSAARRDWQWKSRIDIAGLVSEMLSNIKINSPL